MLTAHFPSAIVPVRPAGSTACGCDCCVHSLLQLDKAAADATEFKAGFDKYAADAAEYKAGYDKLLVDNAEQQAQVGAAVSA